MRAGYLLDRLEAVRLPCRIQVHRSCRLRAISDLRGRVGGRSPSSSYRRPQQRRAAPPSPLFQPGRRPMAPHPRRSGLHPNHRPSKKPQRGCPGYAATAKTCPAERRRSCCPAAPPARRRSRPGSGWTASPAGGDRARGPYFAPHSAMSGCCRSRRRAVRRHRATGLRPAA